VERADRHQILANLDVIARIDIPARDNAINVGRDVAVTKIQFGLSEIASGDLELGLGLLDGRRLCRELSEIAIDVTVFCELVEHLLRALSVRMDNAELGRTLDQVCPRRENRRKGLIEIGRHMAKIFAVIGLRRQPQRGTGLVNFGQVLFDLCVGSRQGFLRLIVRLTALGRGPEQLLCPIEVKLCQCKHRLVPIESGDPSVQKGCLVVEVLHGALQFPAPAHGFCFNTARLGFGRLQVRLCGIDRRSLLRDCNLKRLLVQFGEKLSFLNTVIVIHQNPGNLAADAGGNECHMAVHVCVVRRDGVEREADPGNAKYTGDCQN